jgi:hypothetical protein
MSAAQLKLVIDSIVWAFRHTERNVAETGLALLHDLLVQFAGSEYATQFHQTYYLHLLNEILAVMTGAWILVFRHAFRGFDLPLGSVEVTAGLHKHSTPRNL